MLGHVARALVLEPHPDDLVIGCGGLVQHLVAAGAEVHSLLLSAVPASYTKIYDASGSYEDYDGAARMREAEAADRVLGVTRRTVALGPEWHLRLDALPVGELARLIEDAVRAVAPDLVLVPARSYNQDHRAVFDAFQVVMRPHFYRGMAMSYETTMERDFAPTVLVPLTDGQVAGKLAACSEYRTQLGSPEHLFSLETVELTARYRGRLAYTEAAEAFELLRGVVA